MSSKKTKNQKEVIEKNPFENSFASIGTGVVRSMARDLGRDSGRDFIEQLLGFGNFEKTPQHADSGEMVQGKEVSLNGRKQEQESETPKRRDVEPGNNYHREIVRSERAAGEQTQEIKAKIQEILVELKRIVSSSQMLQIEYKELAVEQRVVKAGKYHVTFFEWLLSVVKSARLKVEDSGAWLAVMKSKKNQKGYWQQFKKHGTSFGLSNERVVATQTG